MYTSHVTYDEINHDVLGLNNKVTLWLNILVWAIIVKYKEYKNIQSFIKYKDKNVNKPETEITHSTNNYREIMFSC